MRPHRFHKKTIARIQHFANVDTYNDGELAEIASILDHCDSTKNHDLHQEDVGVASEKAKIYLAKALAELEVKEQDGKIVFYENKKSWWQQNYPWVIGILGFLAAAASAYFNYLKALKP